MTCLALSTKRDLMARSYWVGPRLRKELQHELVDALPHACRVDPDVGHVVLLGDRLDVLGLGLVIRAPELLAVQQPELAARHARGCNDRQCGRVASVCRVVAHPDGCVGKWALRERLEVVGPLGPRVHHARLHKGQRKH